MDNAPVSSQPALLTKYPVPGYLMIIYALLFIALGWFSHQRWGSAACAISSQITHASALPTSGEQTTSASALTLPEKNAPEDTPAPPEKKAMLPLPAIRDGDIPPLTYSAHVYTSDEAKRSITLNGQQFHEGDVPVEGLIIEQIQHDMTIFSVEGEAFILEALEDWPGGKFKEREYSADDENGESTP
ncbi:type II secretion system assembly factor GspB [Samsonia erythrinae]|uniref:General secretion pathway protein B n=1 Tax=Samsonia erythrinae TaxID=160434 RepID=A0A4R3VLB5_9GAMM|nr:type II secretion system assembly factor GspB [Samsonia erythrinae]TCV07073.1 general secretion pathway protein B [Samsonia erythrinae]